ncbi:hypothetical protein Q8A67_011080 [Cirrhinus molitorella]|uniref:Uncharacterized protein n=1 Tax=Cirrhinus molitorella TaxID=172907 RepID=A0AA88Q1S5_9TELE|nr:hypothetical protein Q8A67_011080 [Cirrhinus molitorella]
MIHIKFQKKPLVSKEVDFFGCSCGQRLSSSAHDKLKEKCTHISITVTDRDQGLQLASSQVSSHIEKESKI